VQTFPTTDEAHQALQEASFAGRTVLIKGSRGMALEALLPAL
jgi:UDP-N-acetylmuramyl pentapeptide synthase